MIELDMTDREAYNIVAVMQEREDKVRLAASLGDPFPPWAEEVEPIQRTYLRLYYQDQRQRERLGRGTSPF